MSFKTKQDYYGLGAVTGLALTGTAENKSLSTAEARGEDGFVVAVESFGETSAPSCDLVVKGDVTLGGTGAHLTSCTLEVAGTIATATKDGEIIAHDLTDVRMTVTANIQVSDSSYGAPSVTTASGWKITGPVSETNPDADFPSYTCQLTKTIAADSAAA